MRVLDYAVVGGFRVVGDQYGTDVQHTYLQVRQGQLRVDG